MADTDQHNPEVPTPEAPHPMDKPRIRARKIKQACAFLVGLVMLVSAAIQTYSLDAAMWMAANGVLMIQSGVILPGLYAIVRSEPEDWANFRRGLPTGEMQAVFDNLVDYSSAVPGSGFTPREIPTELGPIVVYAPRAAAQRLDQVRSLAHEPV